MKRVRRINPRYQEYLNYLDKHISGVVSAWTEILRPAILNDSELNKMIIVNQHDESKYSDEEFYAYLDHFYPEDGSEPSEENSPEYDLAWLHHQKVNPHHFQYWLLIRDDGDIKPLDMQPEYVCEMICDWESFHINNPSGDNAYQWYQNNRSTIVLSNSTSELVDRLLELMK